MNSYNELGLYSANHLKCEDFLNQLDTGCIRMIWTYIDKEKNSAYGHNGFSYFKIYKGEKFYPGKYVLDKDGNKIITEDGCLKVEYNDWGGEYRIRHDDVPKEEVINFLITQLRKKKLNKIKSNVFTL